jgi:uncharacterized ferritin-like protein (DUF455 family)
MVNKKDTKPAEKKGKTGKKPHGRPSLLTEEVVTKIVQALAIGSSYDLASRWAGISYPTFQNWMRIARGAKTKAEAEGESALTPIEIEFLTFLRRVEEAEATVGISWQQVVNRAARTNADDALGMLQRRFDGYSARSPVQLTANIDLSRFTWTPEQLSYIIQYGLTNEQIFRLNAGESPASVLPIAGTSSAPEDAPAGNQPPASGK